MASRGSSVRRQEEDKGRRAGQVTAARRRGWQGGTVVAGSGPGTSCCGEVSGSTDDGGWSARAFMAAWGYA